MMDQTSFIKKTIVFSDNSILAQRQGNEKYCFAIY